MIVDVIVNGATMGRHSTPSTPLCVYRAVGVGDEVSPVEDTDALVDRYCANGASIEYYRNLTGEHVSEAVLGAGGAFDGLKARSDGKAPKGGCDKQEAFVAGPKQRLSKHSRRRFWGL